MFFVLYQNPYISQKSSGIVYISTLNIIIEGDEKDRDMLEGMTEREREEELYKRAEKREELKKR